MLSQIHSYIFFFSPKLATQVLTEIRRPDSAGARTSFQFRTGGLPRDRHLYLALVPADEAGNEGKISNLARVFLDSSVHPYGAGEGGGGGAGGDGPSQKPISSGEGEEKVAVFFSRLKWQHFRAIISFQEPMVVVVLRAPL